MFEGIVGAILTGLMVLLFLHDWRSALVVVLNIPLAILAAIVALWICGQTVNIMTLGGLALAVGILVDEATVTIENIHTHLADGERLGDRVLFAPLCWLGNSDHHLDFPGTLSARPRVYLDLLSGLAEDFIRAGFRRLVFLNGHGGNDVPGLQSIFELRQRHRHRADLLLLLATYWSLGARPWQHCPTLEQREMGHACEWETSMILALAPHLVGDYQSAATVDPGQPFDPVFRAWTTKDRSAVGHIGNPSAASAAKGQGLLNLFTADVVSLLERVANWNGGRWA